MTYTYDGDGNRVQKSNGTLYWHGEGGEVLLETDLAGTLTNEYVFFNGQRIARRTSAGSVYYFFSDHLGSSRIVTDSAGTVVEDSDFYPFGAERVVTDSLNNNYKFTGKERDAESGLDYFGARYYASTLGRFITPDPLMASARISNPQSWNRYSYVLNNPLRWIDPDGMEEKECKAEPCTVIVRVNVIYDKNSNEGKGLTDEQKAKFEEQLLEQAKKEYEGSNIELKVEYTAGKAELDGTKVKSVEGLKEGHINVVVRDSLPTTAQGRSGKLGSNYVTFIGINSAAKKTLALELGHHFLGHSEKQRGFWTGPVVNTYYDTKIDIMRGLQSHGVSQGAFREGAKKFSPPPEQKANEPKKE